MPRLRRVPADDGLLLARLEAEVALRASGRVPHGAHAFDDRLLADREHNPS